MLLIAVEVIQLGSKILKQHQRQILTTVCAACPKPDVYLIISDGYAGKKQLHEQFNFDNSAFEDSLRKLGFYVADSSISNYAATNASISSLLNMNYNPVNEDEDLHAPINKNNVTEFFQQLNYQIVNNSFFKLDGEFPKQPVMYFRTGTYLITRNSFFDQLKQVVHNLMFTIEVASEEERVKKIDEQRAVSERNRDSITMEYLLRVPKTKTSSPRFVYTHFMMPHKPYLFDKNGKELDTAGLSEAAYISYLQYTNARLLKTVTTILQQSAAPPIILLLSDHGYRNDDDPSPAPLRFHNIAAIYLPGGDYKPYYKGISNVNQFRVLLNHQFGQQLPLLPDSTVY